MKNLEFLLQLCLLLAKDNPELAEKVRLASEQPVNYAMQFQEQMLERGLEANHPQLPWLALVNGLEALGMLHELDWKDDPEELFSLCYQMAPSSGLEDALLHLEPHLGDDIEEFLPYLNRNLAKKGLYLAWLDIDSDSYPLAIIPLKNVEKAQELAKKAGYGKIK